MTAARHGRFITLEGGEGAGKTTLAKALLAHLIGRGIEARSTREPGGTPAGDQIRQLLVADGEIGLAPLTEALLFTAARFEHLEQVIKPSLARGAWIICDRYLDSTRAYQAAAGGIAAGDCAILADLIKAPMPDLTLLLDLAPEAGLARSQGPARSEARFERRSNAFHQAVRAAFLRIASEEPARVVVLRGDQAPQAVVDHALAAMHARGWL